MSSVLTVIIVAVAAVAFFVLAMSLTLIFKGHHIDSEIFFSWEQFFTDLLMRITADRDYMRYNKQELKPFYLQEGNVEKLLAAMEE